MTTDREIRCDHIEKNGYRRERRILLGERYVVLCPMCSGLLEKEVLSDFLTDALRKTANSNTVVNTLAKVLG